MALKTYKPTTPSRRGTQLLDKSKLSKVKPLKGLTRGKKAGSGRNFSGRITVRHQGGGVKRRLRLIDHRKDKFDIPGIVETIEYDPNRTADIALIKYADGERRYVLAPKQLKVGQKIVSGENVEPVSGNTLRLKAIPSGTMVFDVELNRGKGGQLGRSAGIAITVQGVDQSGKYVQVKMPSGEIRLVNAECYATVGQVGNEDYMNIKSGKAGRKRHLGVRPSVRGVAMHAKQHPHGGGEGRGGPTAHKDIWGNRIGINTRKNKRTNKFLISRRTNKRQGVKKI